MAARSDLWGGRHPQDRMHFRDAFWRRGQKVADLVCYILPLKVSEPVDSVLASDVAAIDVNQLHFL